MLFRSLTEIDKLLATEQATAEELAIVRDTHVKCEGVFEKWALDEREALMRAVAGNVKTPQQAEDASEYLAKALGVLSLLSNKAENDHSKVVGKIEGMKHCVDVIQDVIRQPEAHETTEAPKKPLRVKRADDPSTPLGAAAAEIRSRKKRIPSQE